MAIPQQLWAEPGAARVSDAERVEASELVRRAQNGDRFAIRELYLAHHESIYRFIWSRVHDPALADDLTGEVFLRMVTHLPRYQDRALPFRAWLYQIARHLLIDDHRRNEHRESVPLERVTQRLIERETPEAITERTMTFARVQQALAGLAPDQREVVEMRFLAGLSLHEVALAVGKTIAAVKSLQHRGLTALRACYQDGE